MAFSGGVFVREDGASGCADEAAAAEGIVATVFDDRLNDIAGGLNQLLLKDGSGSPTANIPMSGFYLTGLGNGATDTSSVNAGQIKNNSLLYGGISSGTENAQTIFLSIPLVSGAEGQAFLFQAGITNTGNATMNIDVNGDLPMLRPNGNGLLPGDITSGHFYYIINNGDGSFVVLNPSPAWNTWSPTIGTVSGSVASSSSNGKALWNLDGNVSFEISFTTTLSSGPTNFFSLTIPFQADSTNPSFSGNYNPSAVRTPVYGSLHDVNTIYVYPSAGGSFSNGTYTISLSGSFKAS